MCHYTGRVRGQMNSFVTMSLCDELGMIATILTDEYDLVVSPTAEYQKRLRLAGKTDITSYLSRGGPINHKEMADHVVMDFADEPKVQFHDDVYQVRETKLPVIAEDSDVPVVVPVSNAKKSSFRSRWVVLSHRSRMREFRSTDAELQDTVAIMNSANGFYRRTWGTRVRLSISSQRQNEIFDPTQDGLDRWSHNNVGASVMVTGWAHTDIGGPVGVASEGSICQEGNLNLIGGVGMGSRSTALNGMIFAHEVGHNFGFDHDSRFGWVMQPWSDESVRTFDHHCQVIMNRTLSDSRMTRCL